MGGGEFHADGGECVEQSGTDVPARGSDASLTGAWIGRGRSEDADSTRWAERCPAQSAGAAGFPEVGGRSTLCRECEASSSMARADHAARQWVPFVELPIPQICMMKDANNPKTIG